MSDFQSHTRAHSVSHTHTHKYTGKVRCRKSIAGSSAKVPCQVVLLLLEEGAECHYSIIVGSERKDCAAQLYLQILAVPA